MLLFAALIALSFSIGHLAAPHIGAGALNVLRFVIGTATMAGVALAARGGRLARPRAVWRYGVLGALSGAYFVTMFIALKVTSPVATGALFTLIPLMSAGFGKVFLGQRTRPMVWLALATAGCGAVWVIFRGDVDAMLAFQLGRGEAVFLVGCVCYAAHAPLMRRYNRGEPATEFAVWTLAAATICIALYGLPELASTDLAALPAIVWAAIAYLAIVTTAGTFLLLQFAALRLPASKVLAYGYLTPGFIILIEGAIGHGWVAPSVAAGAAVTAIALLAMAFVPEL